MSLDHKYKTKAVGAKKFLVAKFLNFVMVDSKLVVYQVQELQLIIHGILTKRMVISESFQVAAIIEKLPPAWNDFKNYLKHKRKEIAKENMVEFKNDFKRGKQPQNGSKFGPNGCVSKKQKFQGKCFNCSKIGHKSSDCRFPKKVKANKANTVEEIFKEVFDMDLCAVIFKVNMVDSNQREWCSILVPYIISVVTKTPFLSWCLVTKGRNSIWAMSRLPRSRGKVLLS
ncbi:hypothetical protein PVK06_007508 [Gossypium arboreum]|uniref:CCHC-type domain-containing protein n=1 Tax=Gossypium arboreum TaxID=29729 RepID=A0ABR0QHH2_GOSAR|nr:hypothetical protein PVK06_007508 [Gossypium arboreum]